MIISVQTFANAINEKRYIKPEEIATDNKIIKITVELYENGTKINYYIDTRNKNRECYTEKNIPCSIIKLMNYNKVSYHEKTKDKELFIYTF